MDDTALHEAGEDLEQCKRVPLEYPALASGQLVLVAIPAFDRGLGERTLRVPAHEDRCLAEWFDETPRFFRERAPRQVCAEDEEVGLLLRDLEDGLERDRVPVHVGDDGDAVRPFALPQCSPAGSLAQRGVGCALHPDRQNRFAAAARVRCRHTRA